MYTRLASLTYTTYSPPPPPPPPQSLQSTLSTRESSSSRALTLVSKQSLEPFPLARRASGGDAAFHNSHNEYWLELLSKPPFRLPDRTVPGVSVPRILLLVKDGGAEASSGTYQKPPQRRWSIDRLEEADPKRRTSRSNSLPAMEPSSAKPNQITRKPDADIWAKSDSLRHPLHWATHQGDFMAVQLHLEKGTEN